MSFPWDEPDVFAGEGWDIFDDAAAQVAAKRTVNGSRESTGVHLISGGRGLLKQAARQRGLSMDAYMSRAIMAFVCSDLGLDWNIVMASEPKIVPFGERSSAGKSLAGTGYGLWMVCDGSR